MEEHRRNALDFINATKWVRENLPYVSVSGGVSNVSFSFRGNDTVREAMHSVSQSRYLVEDVMLDRRDDATERLLD